MCLFNFFLKQFRVIVRIDIVNTKHNSFNWKKAKRKYHVLYFWQRYKYNSQIFFDASLLFLYVFGERVTLPLSQMSTNNPFLVATMYILMPFLLHHDFARNAFV